MLSLFRASRANLQFQSYKHEMKAISQHVTSTDFEVSLAISTQPSPHEDLEDQLFNHGLEYIDGSSPFTLSSSASESDGSVGECIGTLVVVVLSSPAAPGMRRALDALSTIMWPSMARDGTSRGSRTVSSNAQHLDDPDLALQAIIADSGAHSDEFATSRASRMQMEMDELEKWLQDDVTDDLKNDDPWKNKSSSPHAGKNGAKLEPDDDVGFDDDFSDFVSGPSSSHPPDPNFATAHPFSQIDDDESDDLPSRSEIESAASRIFDTERNRELDEGVPSFDLSNILSALQGMKEEIAGIEDESERRKAAAKAALGLVYGLGGYSEMDDDGPGPNPNARRASA